MGNRKIKNATPEVSSGIRFKSRLEAMVYNTLIEKGFRPEYESHKYVLWQGFRPTIPYYTRAKNRSTVCNMKKLISITYTPDFYMEYEELRVIIEVKGQVNDVFPYKFKMFRNLLESYPDRENYMIFEIFTKKQLLECLIIIKEYAARRKDEKTNVQPTGE